MIAGLALIVGSTSAGAIAGNDPDRQVSHGSDVGPDDGAAKNHLDGNQQHGPSTGHLPGSSDNVDLLSALKLTLHEGDISDVSALQTADGRGFAYLGDWGAHCPTGGVHVVDTSAPGAPTEVGQITIPEVADPAFTAGFGDLTVHEVEVPRGDPNEGGLAADDDQLACFSWYAGGFRGRHHRPAQPRRGRPLHRSDNSREAHHRWPPGDRWDRLFSALVDNSDSVLDRPNPGPQEEVLHGRSHTPRPTGADGTAGRSSVGHPTEQNPKRRDSCVYASDRSCSSPRY